jgi:hypothetical protein
MTSGAGSAEETEQGGTEGDKLHQDPVPRNGIFSYNAVAF